MCCYPYLLDNNGQKVLSSEGSYIKFVASEGKFLYWVIPPTTLDDMSSLKFKNDFVNLTYKF
jgi:hypothetical protein